MDKNEKLADELLNSEAEFVRVKSSLFAKIFKKIIKKLIIKDLKEIEDDKNG